MLEAIHLTGSSSRPDKPADVWRQGRETYHQPSVCLLAYVKQRAAAVGIVFAGNADDILRLGIDMLTNERFSAVFAYRQAGNIAIRRLLHFNVSKMTVRVERCARKQGVFAWKTAEGWIKLAAIGRGVDAYSS